MCLGEEVVKSPFMRNVGHSRITVNLVAEVLWTGVSRVGWYWRVEGDVGIGMRAEMNGFKPPVYLISVIRTMSGISRGRGRRNDLGC